MNTFDGVLRALDPVEGVLGKHASNVVALLEILDNLIVFGVHVVLSDVVVLHLADEVGEFFEFVLVEVVLHHQFEDYVLVDHEV
jgi:hypothetical protein